MCAPEHIFITMSEINKMNERHRLRYGDNPHAQTYVEPDEPVTDEFSTLVDPSTISVNRKTFKREILNSMRSEFIRTAWWDALKLALGIISLYAYFIYTIN